jgi:CubicO group peptidase (beta-lactamase class C family)
MNRRTWWCVTALLLVAPTVAQSPAKKPPETLDPAAIDGYLQQQVAARDGVGFSVAVIHGGKTILEKGYGKVSLDGGPVEPQTAFAIGSITKQFACACILLLAEEGKLSVHDKVAKWYPHLTRANDISLYDLMTHVSGYPDYYPLDFLDRRMKKAIALDDLLREYAGGKLDFEPGSKWSYSNTGYILLGGVIEKVSGLSFGRFVERRILRPLGMDRSGLEPRDGSVARGHTSVLLGPAEAVPLEAEGWLQAAGGLFCTAGDLAKWGLGLADGKVLKPESLKLMTTPRQLSTGKLTNYGCGLVIDRQSGEPVWSHSGAVSGFHAYLTILPRLRSVVVVLSNAEQADAAGLQRELVALVLKHQAKKEQSIPKIDGPPAKEAAKALFHEMQEGKVDRAKLGEEFNLYLTDERIREAAPRLKALGDPTAIEQEGLSERGGMEASRWKFVFKDGAVKANMFRSADGKIQQFLLTKGQ